KSYLDIEKIMNAAKEANVDAIHPGYGFLSENPLFVERCEEEGITFIGPNKETMEMMGSKLVSRQKMQEAGVPVVTGSDKELTSIEEAIDIANELTYPLLLKDSVGGGGMGMKYLENEVAFVYAEKQ